MIDLSKLKKKNSYVNKNTKKVSRRPDLSSPELILNYTDDNSAVSRTTVTNPLDDPIEVFPIFSYNDENNTYNFDIWISNKHWETEIHTGISSFHFYLPEWVRFIKPEFWNLVQTTNWANLINMYNGDMWTEEDWPPGTDPQIITNQPQWYIDNGNPFTYWITPGQQVAENEEIVLLTINEWAGTLRWGGYDPQWNWLFEAGSMCIEDGNYDTIYHATIGGKRNIAVLPIRNCNGEWTKPLSVEQNGLTRVLRIENLDINHGFNPNLFNVCMSSSKIKITDWYGDLYTYPNIVGRCTEDLQSVLNMSNEGFCHSMGGILCPNGRECLFNDRFCEPVIDSIDEGNVIPCNCDTFNCRDCFEPQLEYIHLLCCRTCCNPISNPDIGSPEPIEVYGCTSRRACNYNSLATISVPESCRYPEDFGWCDCRGNVEDQCGECGGNGIEWGQNEGQSIPDVTEFYLYPMVGCCDSEKLRTVYFDQDCDGIGETSEVSFRMCQDQITSEETQRYCLQLTDGVCRNCFVQVANDLHYDRHLECSGKVDCAGLCDGTSMVTENPHTRLRQCCRKDELDICGVCNGDNSTCACDPKLNIIDGKFKSGDYLIDRGCICGCTDPLAGNYNAKANWSCGSDGDNSCYSKENNIENGCCWYFKPINTTTDI